MKRSFQIAVLLALLSTKSYAQFQGAAGLAGAGILLTGIALFLHGSVTEQECHNGQLWNVTYLTALGFGKVNVVTQVEGPLGPCYCMVGGGQISPFRPLLVDGFSLVRAEAEGNCTSADNQGNQQTIPSQAAAGSTSGFGGSSSGAGNGPSPDRFGQPRPLFDAQALGTPTALLATRAAPAGSAFTYTLPFRDLPWGPLL
ncbi:MAG TPA: hypothetical protein VEV37_03860, partial [Bryobacteraceae bacterium]|nr:hypothetical protein [Bryobacteraceae bacterium]